jgi:hypothetical protein
LFPAASRGCRSERQGNRIDEIVLCRATPRPSIGITDVTPAIKWQISPIPEKLDLSVTTGIGLPTGAVSIAGPGAQPYLQFPWSVELGHGWAITGMVTNFFVPADPVNRHTNQSSFVIERRLGERAFVFAEYVGEFNHLFNSGGGYRITNTQQIDFTSASV